MPAPIELDPRRWVRVVPQGKSQVVKVIGGACYYSPEPEPPEIEYPGKPAAGTELTENSTLTLEGNIPRWFLAKMAEAERKGEEAFKVPTLEVQIGKPESTGEASLGSEAVTATRIAKEAVETAKVKPANTTGISFSATEKTATELGGSGITRTVLAYANPKHEAHAKVKIVHNLNTEYLDVTVWLLSSKKAKEQLPFTTWIKVVESKSANEVEVEFEKEPGSKEEFVFVIQG
jgi:hypothetical protein